MPINPDFRDLFAEFNAAGVRYLVVGAYAVTFHSEPRYTKDLDLWVEPSAENARRVLVGLASFGAPTAGLSVDDFTRDDTVFQIGIEPNRIDILTGISALTFEPCWEAASHSTYGGEAIRILSLDDLITTKEAAGRAQDRLDVDRLLQVKAGGG